MDKNIMELRLSQWGPIFEAQAKSGLTKVDWCRKNGVRRWEFFTRQRELRNYLMAKNKASPLTVENDKALPSFVEIPVSIEAADPQPEISDSFQDGCITISYHGFSINLSGHVDNSNLETLIRTICHA